ncbi:glycosyltransferase [Modestobacter sp. URMC 112]
MGPSVSVVITTYDHAHFLDAALSSVAAQSRPVDEVIVVDDGSTDDPGAVVAGWPEVMLIRQDNRGLAAARNTGLRAARSSFVLFLDADDLLTPVAVAAGLACFDRHPNAALVYGAHRRIDVEGAPIGGRRYEPVTGDPLAGLLTGNLIAMHATVLYRRDVLLASGGFDERLRLCEDYDVYLRLARSHPLASHPVETALYRWHGDNMSARSRTMLRAVLALHRAHRPDAPRTSDTARAWRTGRRSWRRYYAQEVLAVARAAGRRPASGALSAGRLAPRWLVRSVAARAARQLADVLPGPLGRTVGRALPEGRSRPLGRVRLGDLDRVAPVSADFGWDRGTPVDRFYVERFLHRSAEDVRGHVLEVGDASYSRRFGADRIEVQDVLHVTGSPDATIVGDLSTAGVLPESTFDCVVLTQTLHLVYDMPTAVAHLHASLRPGGVLLLTVPGISQLDRGEWGSTWFWSLTPASAQRLLGDVFGDEAVSVEAHGNAYAATTFLQGLAVEEVDTRKLEARDPAYPVVVTARAQKLRTDPMPAG